MYRKSKQMIVFYYDSDTRRVWGKAGKFVSLEEWYKNPPTRQEDTIPPTDAPSKPDNPDVPGDPGPEIKCIDGNEFVCYQNRCYPTGRQC
jgi:hypothetical protein